ncbi:MAG: hypothetical protein ACSHW1_12840 [Yoonia sp.]|uniref:hypothetical protein n=1 Tax=Yoonia sp. TaxID=2212373 RepID=UPI003EF33E6F
MMMPQDAPADDGMAAQDLLRNTAAALTELNARILKLEAAIVAGTDQTSDFPHPPTALQELDFISQCIVELSELMHRLSPSIPPELAVSRAMKIAPIRVEALRKIISGASADRTCGTQPDRHEIDLFVD